MGFTAGVPPPTRRLGIERLVRHRQRELVRALGRDLLRCRTDMGATQRQVAAIAGVDHSHYARIEAGIANASIESLVAIAAALGADVAVRLYPGTGPRLTDRHQARIVEALIRGLHTVWQPHVEVAVSRPARGVIDVVLERPQTNVLVATEVHSAIHRLEQQIRWSADKATSLPSSDLVGPGPPPIVSRLLVLRSTVATRSLARQFEATLRASYPARCADVIASLWYGADWPGPGLIWARIDGEHVEILDAPPRGVSLGR